jgi:hypothetical protein
MRGSRGPVVRPIVKRRLVKKKVLGKLTFANVVACIALFVALGGASYAAFKLPKNSVGAKQLKKNAVTPAKLSQASKSAIAGPAGPRGVTGPQGPTGSEGPKGTPGVSATSLLAHVGPNGELLSGSGVTKVEPLEGAGNYAVEFNRDVSGCNYQATPALVAGVNTATAAPLEDVPDGVFVATFNLSPVSNADRPFYLAVFCP